MNTILRAAFTLFACLLGLPLWAHPGHGRSGPGHFLTEPEHLLTLLAFAFVVVVLGRIAVGTVVAAKARRRV